MYLLRCRNTRYTRAKAKDLTSSASNVYVLHLSDVSNTARDRKENGHVLIMPDVFGITTRRVRYDRNQNTDLDAIEF